MMYDIVLTLFLCKLFASFTLHYVKSGEQPWVQ